MTTSAITRVLRISDLLRQVWPRDAAKLAAQHAGLSVRTAQAWMADRCSPSWDTVYQMARRNNEIRAALINALLEQDNEPTEGGGICAAGTLLPANRNGEGRKLGA